MKKILIFIIFLIPFCANAADVFDLSGRFELAKAVKLGRGRGGASGALSSLGARSSLAEKTDCDPDCLDGYCNTSGGICSRCRTGKHLYNKKCQDCPAYATCDGVNFTCRSGYYKSGAQCLPCSYVADKCVTCSNGSTCLSCEQGYILKDNACHVKKDCSDYCDDCDYVTGHCLTCSGSAELQSDGTCKAPCPTAAVCAEQNGGQESDWTVSNCTCATNKKYVMMYDQSLSYAGKTLYRIKAMQDIDFKYERKKIVQKENCGDTTIYEDSECQTNYGMTCDEYYENYGQYPTKYACTTYTGYETYDTVSLSVKKGDLGGYIEKESNLSTSKSDKGWVAGTAKVYGDGNVYGGWVADQAVVSGGKVSSGAYVYENAKITGGSVSSAEVFGSATVSAGSVSSYAQVYGNAQQNGCLISEGKLYGNAVVTGCEIHENVEVYGSAHIYGQDVRLWGSVKVYDSAKIKSTSQIYIKGKTFIYGNAQVYGTKNWTASSGYQHQTLTGNGLYIGGTVKFCDNSKKTGTYTSGTYYSSWEGSCNPSY